MTTTIEWVARPGTTPESWNFIGGCSSRSAGCYNCYAARLAGTRLKYHPRYANLTERRSDGSYKWTGEIRLDHSELEKPLHWRQPRTVLPCSMSDLFHEKVPASFIISAYEIMCAAPQHTFIVLTKRPERILPVLYGEEGGWYLGGGDYIPNIWHLVTAENQPMADKRMPELLRLGEHGWPVLGVSCEPLLGPIDFQGHLGGVLVVTKDGRWEERQINWVIVGGESGPGARPMHPQWARDIRDQCVAAGVPYFHKQNGEYVAADGYNQWGTYLNGKLVDPLRVRPVAHQLDLPFPPRMVRVGKKRAGHLLDGEEWHQWPE